MRRLGFWVRALLGPSHDDERGASLVEYALLLALIAVVCVVAVTSMGTSLSDSYSSTDASMFSP